MAASSHGLLSEKEVQGHKIAEKFVSACEAVRTQKLRDEWVLGVIGDWCSGVRMPGQQVTADDFLRLLLSTIKDQGLDWYNVERFKEDLLEFMSLGWRELLRAPESETNAIRIGMILRHMEMLEQGIHDGTAIVTVEEHA